MHKAKSKISNGPVFRQGNGQPYRDREVHNIDNEMMRHYGLDFSFEKRSPSLFDQLADQLDPPKVTESQLDADLENISRTFRINLTTVQISYQAFKHLAENGPFSVPKDYVDGLTPNPIAELAKSYFRNVADASLFREGAVNRSRLTTHMYNFSVTGNPLVDDFGISDIIREEVTKSSENELNYVLQRGQFEFEEAGVELDRMFFEHVQEIDGHYQDVVERENHYERDHYRDSIPDRDTGDSDNDYHDDPDWGWGDYDVGMEHEL